MRPQDVRLARIHDPAPAPVEDDTQRVLLRAPPPPSAPADAYEGTRHPKIADEPAFASDGPRLLPKRLAPGLRLTDGEAKAWARALNSGRPIPAKALPDSLQSKLHAALVPPWQGLVTSAHAGLRYGVFDLSAIARADDATLAAVERYLDPGFVRADVEVKAAAIDAIASVLLPNGAEALRRFHLPRPFGADSAQAPLTFSIEAEARLERRPETLHYYAPDPSGALDPRALPDRLLESFRPEGRAGEIWARMTPDQRRRGLKWPQLPLALRREYLAHYKAEVDDKVVLRRIRDPKAMSGGRAPAPSTLNDTLLWEGSPLRTAEIVTGDKYETADILYDDVRFIAQMADEQPGFHVHHVMALSSPEARRELGPKAVGLAGLEDLRIFARGVRRGSNLLRHTHLEVWSAEGLEDAASSFAKGRIDPDALDVSKFHCVGVRQGIYGDDESRLGLELRAVRVGENLELARVSQRMTDTLASGHLADVPAPPWEGWNAGDPKLLDAAYQFAKEDQPFFADDAKVSFTELFELAGGTYAARDAWKLGAAFWAYERLPGVTAEEADEIRLARDAFAFEMLMLSSTVTEALESGRELDTDGLAVQVRRSLVAFFREAKIDAILDRSLDRIAEGKTP